MLLALKTYTPKFINHHKAIYRSPLKQMFLGVAKLITIYQKYNSYGSKNVKYNSNASEI